MVISRLVTVTLSAPSPVLPFANPRAGLGTGAFLLPASLDASPRQDSPHPGRGPTRQGPHPGRTDPRGGGR